MEENGANDTEEIQVAIDNLQSVLRVSLDLALRCGVSQEKVNDLTSEILSQLADTQPPLESGATLSLSKRDFLASMIGTWHRDQAYVDELGDPAILPSSGDTPSLASLHEYVTRLLSHAPLSSTDAIDLLVKHETIEEADGGWRPTGEYFQVKTSTSAGVHPQLAYLAELSSTVNHNISNPVGTGLFCVTSRVSGFPKSRTGQILSACNDSGMNFITELDTMLTKGRTDNLELKDESATVGVCAYMFIRDPRKRG